MNFKTLRWYLKNFVSNNYYGFMWITKPFAKRQSIMVNKDTDIMIEGYPRSGNTFAVAAFNFAQNKELRVARHRHEVGHVLLAVKLEKPIVVIVREPLNAIVSLCIREEISIIYALKYYIEFYKKLLPYKCNILFIDFNEIVTDMGMVIKNINNKFNTDFSLFIHNEQNTKLVKEIVYKMDQQEILQYSKEANTKIDRTKSVAFPSKKRDEIKNVISLKIRNNSIYLNLLSKAEKLYKECLL